MIRDNGQMKKVCMIMHDHMKHSLCTRYFRWCMILAIKVPEPNRVHFFLVLLRPLDFLSSLFVALVGIHL